MFSVLDLFAGIGGTTLGILTYLESVGINCEYIAVEYDPEVIEAREELFHVVGETYTHTILNDNAYTFLNYPQYSSDKYDFIWASPPCKTHSQLNMYQGTRNPDMRLWKLIKTLQQQKTPFVVENVKPYYKTPIKPTFKAGRHWFWSNKPIDSFAVPEKHKNWDRMEITDWSEYHGIETRVTDHIKDRMKRRQVLRNMTHPDISYNIIKQILNPKQKQLEVA